MRKKKEYKKPLLADADDDDDGGGGFGILGDDDNDELEEALTAATSMFSSEDDDDDSLIDQEGEEDLDVGDSVRSVSSAPAAENNGSGHKRVTRKSRGQTRRSFGAMNGNVRSRRCDRAAARNNATTDRKSPGPISRKSLGTSPKMTRKSAGSLQMGTSPKPVGRKSVVSASPKPTHGSGHRKSIAASPNTSGRRGARGPRRRSIEAHLASPLNQQPKESSGHSRSGHSRNTNNGSLRGSGRRTRTSTVTQSPHQSTVNMLYAGNVSADDLLIAPNLDDDDDDHLDDNNNDVEEEADDAELVRDELADLEGLIQAAKGVGVS